MENIYNDVVELRNDVHDIKVELRDVRNALLGDDYDRTGLATLVGDVVKREQSIAADLRDVRMDQVHRAKEASRRRRAAVAVIPILIVASWILATSVLIEYRDIVGISHEEARIGITIMLALVSISGGFIGSALSSPE